MPDLVTLAEAKAWLDITDTARDELLTFLASAASDALADLMGGQDLLLGSRTEVLSGGGGPTLPVNGLPLVSVTSVTIDAHAGGAPIDPVNVTFTNSAIVLRSGVFPRGIKNVTVVYSSGLSAITNDVKLAARYTVKAMWDAKATSMNGTGEMWNGIGGESFWPTGPGCVPPQARELIRSYIPTYKAT